MPQQAANQARAQLVCKILSPKIPIATFLLNTVCLDEQELLDGKAERPAYLEDLHGYLGGGGQAGGDADVDGRCLADGYALLHELGCLLLLLLLPTLLLLHLLTHELLA